MMNIKEEFLKAIEKNQETDKMQNTMKNIVFELSEKKLSRLKDNKKREQRAIELLKSYVRILEEENMENINMISIVIEGVSKALSNNIEQDIYEKITQVSKLEKEIEEEKEQLKNTIYHLYENIEKSSKTFDDKVQKHLEKAIEDIKLKDIVLLGILKETTEEALLTVLENQQDIEEITNQITQNIVFQAIKEEEFSKQRLMDISKTVLDVAVSIADEYQAVAKEILKGATIGIKNGIVKSINKFNENIEFLPDEIRDSKQEKILFEGLNIIDANIDYQNLLIQSTKESRGISKDILNDIANNTNLSLNKIKKITNDTKENIIKKIEQLKDSPAINDLKNKLSQKLSELHIEKRIKSIKKEDIENIAKESKKLGKRAWEVAKNAMDNAVKNTKESLYKNEDDENKKS